MKKLKSILSNRNTVTFIGIILIALVLYAFYKYFFVVTILEAELKLFAFCLILCIACCIMILI